MAARSRLVPILWLAAALLIAFAVMEGLAERADLPREPVRMPWSHAR